MAVVTATPNPNFTPPPPSTPPSLPTANADERKHASNTWLYLSYFQSGGVSVIDPKSGHVLHEVQTVGDRAGAAISPDGKRLYIVDGTGNAPGSATGALRVFDTADWQVIHEEPLTDLATLFSNPVSLSGDGRWLFVAYYSAAHQQAWVRVFNTQRLRFLPESELKLPDCIENAGYPNRVVGRPGHAQLYANCHGFVAAFEADTLTPRWQAPTPQTDGHSDLALAPDGMRLFGLYPQVTTAVSHTGDTFVASTDLLLKAWNTTDGDELNEIKLSKEATVPLATLGRGDTGYLEISPDGTRLYVVWEDKVWTLTSDPLHVTGELKLPAPADGVALSVDGRELYLLRSEMGNLNEREHEMWTVDTTRLKLARQTSDWPKSRLGLTGIGFFNVTLEAAPTPSIVNP